MRGDLYRLKAQKGLRGHEQAGARFAVVVQSDDLPLSTWLVAPTSTGWREASFRPEIEINDIGERARAAGLRVPGVGIRTVIHSVGTTTGGGA